MVRTGIGFDAHRLVKGRALVLGGVRISHDKGLEGHSDADVVAHAIADALLGAAAEGDIGIHFPSSDPQWAGADSVKTILAAAAEILKKKSFSINNVDCTILAQAPALAPHFAEMRRKIGAALGLPPARVSIKATTTERLGFAGRGEGIAAIAVACVTAPG